MVQYYVFLLVVVVSMVWQSFHWILIFTFGRDGQTIRVSEPMAPPWGLSTPRAPIELFQKIQKSNLVRNMCLSFGLAPHFA